MKLVYSVKRILESDGALWCLLAFYASISVFDDWYFN